MSKLKANVSLKAYSNYNIGGPADYFASARNERTLKDIIRSAHVHKLPLFILGGGTNLIISDEGISGLVVRPEMHDVAVTETSLTVGAGMSMEEVLELAALKGLSGLEWAGGLPGTIGGAVRGNAGAFGGEMKDVVQAVESMTLSPDPQIFRRTNGECAFGYRTSIFKTKGDEVVTRVTLALAPGEREKITFMTGEKIEYRQTRHPMEYPNIGSTFKNVDARNLPEKQWEQFARHIKTDPFPVIPTAYLIAEAGLKGVSHGGAMISPKHPNFIVNVLDATAHDVHTLIALAKSRVKEKFNLDLEEEVMRV